MWAHISGHHTYSKFEYTVRSNSDPAKISILQGPGCRTQNGIIVKCGSNRRTLSVLNSSHLSYVAEEAGPG